MNPCKVPLDRAQDDPQNDGSEDSKLPGSRDQLQPTAIKARAVGLSVVTYIWDRQAQEAQPGRRDM